MKRRGCLAIADSRSRAEPDATRPLDDAVGREGPDQDRRSTTPASLPEEEVSAGGRRRGCREAVEALRRGGIGRTRQRGRHIARDARHGRTTPSVIGGNRRLTPGFRHFDPLCLCGRLARIPARVPQLAPSGIRRVSDFYRRAARRLGIRRNRYWRQRNRPVSSLACRQQTADLIRR